MKKVKYLLGLVVLWGVTMVSTTTQNTTSCRMTLANNRTTKSFSHLFEEEAETNYRIFFRLRQMTSERVTTPLELDGDNTFAPDLWVWASGEGRSLLRLPLDHQILSLGLLTLKTTTIEVLFDVETSVCLKELPYSLAVHHVGKFLYENITGNGLIGRKGVGDPIVCRSVFAFEHLFYGKRGVGFECCEPGDVYVCEQHYSEDFQLVWYGPIVLMCCIYFLGCVHCYKLYNKSFEKKKVRQLSGVVKSISEMKADILTRIISNTQKLIHIHRADDLIAMRERIRLLDVMGIGKVRHRKILFFVRIILAILAFFLYYIVWGIFLYAYDSQLGNDLKRMKDSKTVYLNVVGHIGWVFSSEYLKIHKYAIFECCYTALIPPMLVYIYFSLKTNRKNVRVKPSAVNSLQQEFCKTFSCHSVQGRVMQYIFSFLILLHFLCISGVFLAYVTYLVGLGLLANIDMLSPWAIPILLSTHLFANSFNSAYDKYYQVKDYLFALCLEDFKELMIKQNKEYFLPRDLIEKYYIPSSRSIVYSSFLRLFWAFTALLLLTLVVLTLQYPYNSKLSSLAPFLGVQVVLVLPYLARTLSAEKPHYLEGVLLKKDLREYISKYVEEKPEMTHLQDEDQPFDPVAPPSTPLRRPSV